MIINVIFYVISIWSEINAIIYQHIVKSIQLCSQCMNSQFNCGQFNCVVNACVVNSIVYSMHAWEKQRSL